MRLGTGKSRGSGQERAGEVQISLTPLISPAYQLTDLLTYCSPGAAAPCKKQGEQTKKNTRFLLFANPTDFAGLPAYRFTYLLTYVSPGVAAPCKKQGEQKKKTRFCFFANTADFAGLPAD